MYDYFEEIGQSTINCFLYLLIGFSSVLLFLILCKCLQVCQITRRSRAGSVAVAVLRRRRRRLIK